VALEVTGEMGLIVEADIRRDLGDRYALEQRSSRGVDPACEHVAVRRDPKRSREAPHEMGGGRLEEASGVVQGDALEEVLVEQVPEIGRELLVRAVHHRFHPLTEVPPQPKAHAHERRLRRACLVRVSEEPVQRSELANEPRIIDVGIVHGPTDQVVVEDVAPDVENPLAEPGAGGRSPVVHDMRRQDRHSSAGGATVPPLKVVPDRALVDDEHRPGLVGVPWVDVIDEPSVEDLVDAGDRRLPCAYPFAGRGQDVKIVQDRSESPVLDGVDASPGPGPRVNDLVGLVAFAFVGTVSPGPNNSVLWASGLRFGFRRTIPHVLGTALGIGALVVGVAAGIGAFLEAIPAAELVLKVVGSVYLLYVAYLLGSGGIGRREVSNPLSLWQAIVFQCVNPKAWIFVIAAVGTFLSPDLRWLVGVSLLTGTLMVVVVASSSIWAAGGAALGRVVDDERMRRVISVGLAALLVASVALLWI